MSKSKYRKIHDLGKFGKYKSKEPIYFKVENRECYLETRQAVCTILFKKNADMFEFFEVLSKYVKKIK